MAIFTNWEKQHCVLHHSARRTASGYIWDSLFYHNMLHILTCYLFKWKILFAKRRRKPHIKNNKYVFIEVIILNRTTFT